jgi:ketosteroid isomerase-like protein
VLDRAGFELMWWAVIGRFQRFDLTITEVVPAAEPGRVVADYDGDALSHDGRVAYRNSYIGIFDIADGKLLRWREWCDTIIARRMNEQLAVVPVKA